MGKNKKFWVMGLIWSLSVVFGLGFAGSFVSGCGQQSTSTTTTAADYSKASTDLKNVASGAQSMGGSSGKGANSSSDTAGGGAGQAQSLSVLGVAIQDVKPSSEGWTNHAYSYTYTASGGVTVSDEGTMDMRITDANGIPVSDQNIATFEPGATPGTGTIRFKAKYMTIHEHFSTKVAGATKASGEMNIVNAFPTSISFPISSSNPITMTAVGTGAVTFVATTVSTFDVGFTMTITTTGSQGGGSATGTMTWGYLASTYTYYYGTLSMTMSDVEQGKPSAMTGDVYQDLTNDGTNNGVKVGTITMDPSVGIKITLDNGTIIYAGTF